ncbi:MAG: hypothetical protein KKF56_00585 [Nanoarchaeota archaeon]|nr:hypothetical protein [Nanoarchaeota archaeon]
MGEVDNFIAEINPKYKDPLEEHQLIYDSPTEGMEPVYFWLLDFLQPFGKIEKVVDNFSSTPGSGHFSELSGKKTQMQNEISKLLGQVNLVVKGVINLIYDLKEYEIRLKEYDDAKSSDKKRKDAGDLGLKQVWMDVVDVKRGAGSINGMSQQLNFVTLRDAYMMAKSEDDVDKMDLNDRVKRVLKYKLIEFFEWKKRSEQELRKRFEIEKTYLKSQVSTLKLYSRWLKPYMKAAAELEMKNSDDAALVTAFSTTILELTLLVTGDIDFEQAIIDGDLPDAFAGKKLKREYHPVVLVEFKHRGFPQRVSQQGQYAFGGRTEVSFKAYSMNDEELAALKTKLDEQDISDIFKINQGVADESLDQLQDDIEYYLGEDSVLKKKDEKKKEDKGDVNPFSALWSIFKRDKGDGENKKGKIKKDSFIEKTIRELAENIAKKNTFNAFDVYKKGHRMPSPPEPFYDN